MRLTGVSPEKSPPRLPAPRPAPAPSPGSEISSLKFPSTSPATVRFPPRQGPQMPPRASSPDRRAPGVVVGQGESEREITWDEIDAVVFLLLALLLICVATLIVVLV